MLYKVKSMKTQLGEIKRMQQLAGILKEDLVVDKQTGIDRIIDALERGEKVVTKIPEKIGQLYIQVQTDGKEKEGVMDVDKAKEAIKKDLTQKQTPEDIEKVMKKLDGFKNAKFDVAYQSGEWMLQRK